MRKTLFSLALFLIASISGCTSLKIWLDNDGIEEFAEMILEDYQPESLPELQAYLKSSKAKTEVLDPRQIRIEKLEGWHLKDIPIQKKISFPSTLKKKSGEKDQAIFYLYGNRELRGQKVILWIPGFGVSDLAFRFIKTFFYNELKSGYAVLFYNIPYHLNRIEQDAEMGEGLFTGNNKQNLETIDHILFEIDTAIKYLESQEVESISGWGGSIGAAFLWMTSQSYAFEHITLMIPIVDWTTLIFHEGMSPVLAKMNAAGISNDLLQTAYRDVSPLYLPTKTDPGRIQILYARYDQFTPEEKIKEFANKWAIRNVIGYEESHASILINDKLYEDNLRFLRHLEE